MTRPGMEGISATSRNDVEALLTLKVYGTPVFMPDAPEDERLMWAGIACSYLRSKPRARRPLSGALAARPRR